MTLDEGLQYVNHTYETSQKLMPRLKATDATRVAQETDGFQSEHRAIQNDLTARANEIEAQLDTWRNYNELEAELSRCLALNFELFLLLLYLQILIYYRFKHY